MAIVEENILSEIKNIKREVLNGENFDRTTMARSLLNYPAMMVPSSLDPIVESLKKFCSDKPAFIDPFMGASNSLVIGMKYGFEVYGQDINPLSVLLSQVKTSLYNESHLTKINKQISMKILKDTSKARDVSFTNRDKWFTEKVQIKLSKIRRAIKSEKRLSIRKFFWVALAETVRVVSNDRTSTFKLHIRSQDDLARRDIDPIAVFNKIVNRSIRDITSFNKELRELNLIESNQYKFKAKVKWGDSKEKIKTTKKFDLLITSPPYGDNHTTVTYGQFSYLPLQWIPMSDIDENIEMDYLLQIHMIDSMSLGGKMLDSFEEIKVKMFSKSKNLKKYFASLNEDQKNKAKKVINFIYDLDITIDNALTRLKNGAYMLWTIGNRSVNGKVVQNDLILIDLMQSKGVELVTGLERDILSKRMPLRNNFSKTMKTEKILIFKCSQK